MFHENLPIGRNINGDMSKGVTGDLSCDRNFRFMFLQLKFYLNPNLS